MIRLLHQKIWWTLHFSTTSIYYRAHILDGLTLRTVQHLSLSIQIEPCSIMSKLIVTATVLILSMIHISIVYGASLPCANCDSVQCGPRPQGCELGKLPCGCCYVCLHNVGEICEAFAPRYFMWITIITYVDG